MSGRPSSSRRRQADGRHLTLAWRVKGSNSSARSRQPQPGTIVHADRGAQYTSWIFGHRLREAGLLGSMGRVAASVDNSMMESFWSTMQRELLDRQPWTT